MVEDLNFVQLGQIPDCDSTLLRLYELQSNIGLFNKKVISKSSKKTKLLKKKNQCLQASVCLCPTFEENL